MRGPRLQDHEAALILARRRMPELARAWQRHTEDSRDDEVLLHIYNDCSGRIMVEPGGPLAEPWKVCTFADPDDLLVAIDRYTKDPAKMAMVRGPGRKVDREDEQSDEDTDERHGWAK